MTSIIGISFIGNVAFGTVAIIFPNQALEKGLDGTFAGIIIAGYPIAQMVFTPLINTLLNTKGKKYTLFLGGFS
jgi:MFS family permease